MFIFRSFVEDDIYENISRETKLQVGFSLTNVAFSNFTYEINISVTYFENIR